MEKPKIICKKCGSTHYRKNGFKRDKQNYQCKKCNSNFVVGDQRKQKLTDRDKALILVLYGSCRASYRFLGKLFNVSHVTIMKYLKKYSDSLPEPSIDASITSVSFDEMCHFLGKKNRSCGFGVQWSVFEIGLSGGALGIVLVRHS
jgi:transposase-like protein